MLIKHLDKNTIDVFWGTGWDNWSRMKIGKKGYWKMTQGKYLPSEVFKDFKQEVKK